VSLVLLFGSLAWAQRDLGTITGTVTDPSGAIVPGATITITEDLTGLKYNVETTATGDYTRPALPPGIYTVTAQATGFRPVSELKVAVTAGSRVGVPLVLAVGGVTESVMVTGQAPMLQAETAQLGNSLESNAVGTLPLGGTRNVAFLALLSAGVLPGEQGTAGGNFSANGVRSTGQNNFLLNGVDNNNNTPDQGSGTAFVVGPPPEAIGEVTVVINGYNAEYGRGAGGVIDVTLKQGTNQLHGGLWEVLQNTDLNANSWSNNRVGAPSAISKQNQFGAAAGGPIVRNRWFIFGDYQGTRAITQSQGYQTIPTPAEVQGNFSGLLGKSLGNAPDGSSVGQYQIYDPLSTYTVNGQLDRTPFVGNIIPKSRFDPAAAKVLSLLPAPNQPVNGFPINDYYSPAQTTDTPTNSGDLRSDFRLNDKDSFYGSLSWSDQNVGTAAIWPTALGTLGGNGGINNSRSAQIGYTRVWSPSIVSETRVAINRMAFIHFGATPTTDEYTAFGVAGYDTTTADTYGGGLPTISMSRYASLGASEWDPTIEHNTEWDFIQNLLVMKGSHSFKFGAEVRPTQFPYLQAQFAHGQMQFSQNDTAYPSMGQSSTGQTLYSNTGDGAASFLLGVVNSGFIGTGSPIFMERDVYAFYAQDDWKVTPKLTVNYGLRYELFSPSFEKNGRLSNLVMQQMPNGTATLDIAQGPAQNTPLSPNFALAFPDVTVTRGVSKYMYPWDKLDFGPRFGLAYRFASKMVLRAGFGIFYGGEENLGGSGQIGNNVPFNNTVSLGRTTATNALTPIGTFDPNPFFPGGFSGGFPSSPFTEPAGAEFRSTIPDSRSPMVKKWNLAVQRELGWNTAFEVAYVGNYQSHQIIQFMGNPCPNLGTTNPSITCTGTELIPNISEVLENASFGFGNYNGLTVKVEKRLSGGLQFVSAYSWTHALSNSNTALAWNTYAANPLNESSNYSNAEWDIRHSFTTGFTYEVPIGKGRKFGTNMNPVLNNVVGGWALNGILSIRTGRPTTLGWNGCQGVWNSCRPDIIGNINNAPSGGRSAADWFTNSDAVPAAPLTGGDAGPMNIWGPGTSTLDASLFKNFRMTERFNLQFRLEGFNVFNKTQLGNPDTNLQDSTFGQITSASHSRTAQVSLRVNF
jgi:hypothetical protein